MSLTRAELPGGSPVSLPERGPFSGQDLEVLRGVPFELPCDDPWILGPPQAQHAYLQGASTGWEEYPEWMDFLDPDSPGFDLKRAERDVYLHHWGEALVGAQQVLDVGCGVGRFTAWLMDRGCDVWGVDADLESLRRCAWHAAGRPGRLDLHWSSAHRLPEVEVDAAIAVEVLCYVPRPVEALREMAARVRPGGAVLVSVEARWGWATAQDAPPGALEEALAGTGVVDMPGDRWVRTYEEEEVRALMESADLEVELCLPTHYLTDGPLERCLPEELDLQQIIDLEERCRAHPVWRPLNRAWTAIGRK